MASYTSVSLMSTSAWNISGSPVVSPSRWNPIVASNLCVIALHDHSGSAGEGASTAVSASQFPTVDVQYIWPWFPVTNTCWVAQTASDWPGLGYMATSSLGAVLEYDVYMQRSNAAGEQWTVTFFADGGSGTAAQGGALSCCIGGIKVELPSPGSTLDRRNIDMTNPFTIDPVSGFIIDSVTTLNTANYTSEGIKGNGRTKLRFQTVPRSGSTVGNEIRLGCIKVRRQVA